jgi:hypothetical protein
MIIYNVLFIKIKNDLLLSILIHILIDNIRNIDNIHTYI